MRAEAPDFRSVDALTGERVESPIGKILDAADEISGQAAELDRLRRDNEMLTRQADALCELSYRVQELEAERDDLSERLASLTEASEFTLGLLAKANRDRDLARNERDTYRVAVSQ